MSDVIDRADKHVQSWLDNQIRQITAHQKPNDTDECVDCGNLIGAERKKALSHAVRCVGCQWQFERTHVKRSR